VGQDGDEVHVGLTGDPLSEGDAATQVEAMDETGRRGAEEAVAKARDRRRERHWGRR
jgi:hypothetical protein